MSSSKNQKSFKDAITNGGKFSELLENIQKVYLSFMDKAEDVKKNNNCDQDGSDKKMKHDDEKKKVIVSKA